MSDFIWPLLWFSALIVYALFLEWYWRSENYRKDNPKLLENMDRQKTFFSPIDRRK